MAVRLSRRLKERNEGFGKQLGLFFWNKVAGVGNHDGRYLLKTGFKCLAHSWNGVLPAYSQ